MKNQTVQPFKEIDDIEEDIQKFLHLGGMNSFMVIVFLFRIIDGILSDEKNATNITKLKSLKRNDII